MSPELLRLGLILMGILLLIFYAFQQQFHYLAG